jgi:alpha-beta hydrolase superfamily lysophospholipase
MMKSVFTSRILGLLFLSVAAHAAAAPREEAVTLTTAAGQLAGTLALPAQAAKVPVALIIAGSGPTDRDGNSALLPGHNDSLRMLAAALAEHGIASLRYDKRGIGASAAAMTAESDLRFDTYVDDAAGWLARLAGDPRFSGVIVIGHSEGSLIGMLAAQRAKAVAFVSVSGVAQSAPAILRKQLAGKLPPDLAQENERILATLERGELPGASVPAPLAALYRPGVQPYLVSWIKYVPADRIKALRVPVLIAQGTTDIQVDVDEAQALKAAKPDAVLAIVPGMNHVLKLVPADMKQQMASYADPALPLAPQLVSAVVDFVHALPAPAQRP